MGKTAEYLIRNLGPLTGEQQEILRQSSAAVIGCGGLGGYVVEELVRIGVGRLLVFDPDVFSPSNCNRQLYATQKALGQNKAEVARERAAAIHPLSSVQAYPTDFRRACSADDVNIDVVIDCLDDIAARLDLASLCQQRHLPLVHGAVHGWYGQVGVQLPGTDLLKRLYPGPVQPKPAKPPSVLSFTVAVVASLQACEAVKLLLNLPSPLHDCCMQLDLKSCDFEIIA